MAAAKHRRGQFLRKIRNTKSKRQQTNHPPHAGPANTGRHTDTENNSRHLWEHNVERPTQPAHAPPGPAQAAAPEAEADAVTASVAASAGKPDRKYDVEALFGALPARYFSKP